MFKYFFSNSKKKNQEAAYIVYSSIVEQSRKPEFYIKYQVPDTLEGRFDLLILNLFLVIDRLKSEGEEEFNQILFDTAFYDMDQNLRQMGIGDLSIPRHIKKMAKAFYGRSVVYQDALDKKDVDALKEALKRNLFATVKDVKPKTLDFFASYLKDQRKALKKQKFDNLKTNGVYFAEFKWAKALK